MPDVFADHHAVFDAVEFEHERPRVRGEVTLLVEHFAVGQFLLQVSADHLAVDDQRGRVEGIDWRHAALDWRVCFTMAVRGVAVRMTDHHVEAGERLQLFGEIGKRGGTGGIKGRAQQQVFGRVAGEREFGSDEQLGTIVVRSACCIDDFRDVAGEVADGDIDLSKSDSGLHGRIRGKPRSLPVASARWLDETDKVAKTYQTTRTNTDKRAMLRQTRRIAQIRNSQTD